ncbi:Uncharacterized protein ML0378 [Coccomyxa sp. Obi]|nr:Uncharacterized protein ML0378 [Coccomyxa sp. Obi]
MARSINLGKVDPLIVLPVKNNVVDVHRAILTKLFIRHEYYSSKLERRTFNRSLSLSREEWTKETKRNNTLLLYAVHRSARQNILGYAFVTVNKLVLHVVKVAVDVAHRRIGIASRLIKEALRVARRSCATLHVDPRNEAAMKLYHSLGFELDGILDDYYSPGCPAHKLLLTLEQS